MKANQLFHLRIDYDGGAMEETRSRV